MKQYHVVLNTMRKLKHTMIQRDNKNGEGEIITKKVTLSGSKENGKLREHLKGGRAVNAHYDSKK